MNEKQLKMVGDFTVNFLAFDADDEAGAKAAIEKAKIIFAKHKLFWDTSSDAIISDMDNPHDAVDAAIAEVNNTIYQ